MRSLTQVAVISAFVALAQGQAVLLKAQGATGSPASLGLQVNPGDPKDANVIKVSEISTNVVNECGRTLSGGNIDIGENTENALAAGNVTKATKGSTIQVTMRQGGAQGAGPFTCDLDPQGNALASGQTNLTVSQAKTANGQLTMTVTLPKDMACTGSSAGNVCTVRCINKQEFGGCFAVQQTDTTPLPPMTEAGSIKTAQTLDNVLNQVQQNVKDLPQAMQGIATSGPTGSEQGVAVVNAIEGDKAKVTTGNTGASTNAGTGATTGTGTNTGTAKGNGNQRGGKKKNGGLAALLAGAGNRGKNKRSFVA